MCGIVAYKGYREAYPLIIKGLQRLEYRGYDSAGVALLNGDLNVYKKAGKVATLAKHVKTLNVEGHLGMGHTRWATHGEPNDINAHPHLSESENFAIIHNGIIENYASIKQMLLNKGRRFTSDTDTEVLINLIEYLHENGNYEIEEAVRLALNEVHGAYAIVVLSKQHPDKMIAARLGSPIVIGIGKDKQEYFVASDATPIVEYTKDVVYLDDGEMAVIDKDELRVKNIESDEETEAYVHELEMDLEMLEKGGFEHFMLKEIYEQPVSIADTMRGRIDSKSGTVKLGGIEQYLNKFLHAPKITIVACGTSWHAGLVAEYLIEELARIPVEVEYASEFRYRNPIVGEEDVVIAISQSGETADTLAAIELAKSKGATIIGICNVVGSSIPRATHAGSYTHAGPEIGVASTKAFTSQVTVLTLLALQLAKLKGSISSERYMSLLQELEFIPDKINAVMLSNNQIEEIAAKYQDAKNALYLGRGYGFPVALEGALKLKEISYIHAEGYPAAEMKHGPIALIDEEMPVVVIATQNASYEKVVSNIQEVKARKGKIIAIVTRGDETVRGIADHIIEIPMVDDILLPLVSVVPLQLLSYHIAVMRGCNVDQPRNLAKSVTVE